MKKTLLTLLPSVILTLSSCAIIAGDTKIQNIVDEDCHRGTLDERYCDRDYDLVADLPLDAKNWINPDTLVFSYTPVEKPEIYAEVWEDFIKHLARVTGKKVTFLPVRSYSEQYAAIREGNLHIAGVNTGGNPVAVSCSGMVPFAMMASEDGTYGYEMEIIVPKGSDIKFPVQIKGHTLALTSPSSNSGNKAPITLLKSEFGLVKNRDFKVTFSGTHSNSVMGIVDKDYEVAAVSNAVLNRMINRRAVDPETITSIYKSTTFPTTGYGHAHNLHPELAAKIKQAFFTFKWEGSALQKEFKNEGRFISIYHKSDWNVIRKIDAANGISYDCDKI